MTEANTMDDIMHPGLNGNNEGFPDAPAGWAPDIARQIAGEDGLELSDDHWKLLHALQEYYSRHVDDKIHVRELHDALAEIFHTQGGLKFLYKLFPGGPIAQGCRLAGLEAPAGAADKSFGSVI